ncbi:MAG: thiamine pyrophosphate-binding protein [Elusimicrobia bacterium]|nr:thiamine pyrophosphate-binding protein [Elusimicrobiota bacterium]
MRVADYIAETLADRGIRHVFLVTGGGAMHLNDAIGRCKRLSYVACHHEQACAIAAESYARMTNTLAAVNVTTGPGGTNAITGVWGAWTDSIGMIVVSGQVKFETTVRSTPIPLRQLGDQELDIVRLVAPITKYAVMVTDPKTIRYHLERALHLASSGRPGPVWLDVPMNVQGAQIETSELSGYDPREDAPAWETKDLDEACREILDRLGRAERPVVLAGGGVRLSGAHDDFVRLVDRLGVPVVTAWNAHDAIWNAHPCYVGRPGTVGDRTGNFAVQNSDFLLVLGCRLNIRQISYNWENFARGAFKAMVDADAAELKKPTLKIDLPVHADLKDALAKLARLDLPEPSGAHRRWLDWCLERRRKYPVVLPSYRESRGGVNPYVFVEALFRELPEGERVVTGDGTACVVTFQAADLKKGQRLYTNSGCASMGYDLPAAVGASVATDRGRIVCLAGDGSIQMNLQELQTIVTHRLPIKLFVLNNQGYHSIRQTQRNFFPDNVVGCGTESGLGFPDFGKLAGAYGIPYRRAAAHADLAEAVRETLAGDGPRMCEILLDLKQAFAPKLSSRRLEDGRMVSSPLEDMFPFLPRDEFLSNMIVAPLEDSKT